MSSNTVSLHSDISHTLAEDDGKVAEKGVKVSPSESETCRTPASTVGDHDEDGGIRGWLQVLACWFVYWNTWGVINTFSTFETYYILVLPQTPSTIAWIGTVEGFTLLVFGTLSGSLNDRGYFRELILGGSFLIVFGIMMTSLGTQYYQLMLAQGVCMGIAASMLYFPSMATTATYFKKHRAFAMGVAAAGGQLSGVIYPIVFRQLIGRIGFGWTVRVIGFIALGTLTITNLVHRRKVLPTPKKFFDTAALTDLPFLTFAAGIFILFIGLYQPLYYSPTYGEVVLGMTPDDAFYITAILNACSIVGCIIPALLGDYFGLLTILIPSAVVTSMLAFIWISVDTVAKLQAFVAFYGFFTGVLISLINPTLASMSPTLERVASRVGMGYTFSAFGILIGSPLGGLLLDLGAKNFRRTQVWGGCFVMGAAILFTITKWLQLRQRRISS